MFVHEYTLSLKVTDEVIHRNSPSTAEENSFLDSRYCSVIDLLGVRFQRRELTPGLRHHECRVMMWQADGFHDGAHLSIVMLMGTWFLDFIYCLPVWGAINVVQSASVSFFREKDAEATYQLYVRQNKPQSFNLESNDWSFILSINTTKYVK
jgi:hypothetical protein